MKNKIIKFFSKNKKIKLYQIIIGIFLAIAFLAIVIVPVSITGAQIEKKFSARIEAKNILIKDYEGEIKEWKEHSAEIIELKNDYSFLLKEVVDLLYLKNMPVGGGSRNVIEETDQITIKALRSTIEEFKQEKNWMGNIKDYLLARKKFVNDFPFIYPVQNGAPSRISSPFGYRKDVFKEDKGLHFHTGVDFPGDLNEPVIATADGRVIYTSRVNEVYGLFVVLKHEMGFLTYYAHLNDYYVRIGQEVKRGEVIGGMGNTGMSLGVHLHYEVRVGENMSNSVPKDPLTYMTSNY